MSIENLSKPSPLDAIRVALYIVIFGFGPIYGLGCVIRDVLKTNQKASLIDRLESVNDYGYKKKTLL